MRPASPPLPPPLEQAAVAHARQRKVGRPLTSSLNVQIAAGAEASTLGLVGGVQPPRRFFRPKGSIDLGWHLSKTWDVNVKLRRRVVQDHIREVRRESGTTVVMTTHDMDEADELCDTLAIMHHGRVSATGSPASLKATVGSEATLDDVFIHFSGGTLDEGGGYRDAVRTRRTARRLG